MNPIDFTDKELFALYDNALNRYRELGLRAYLLLPEAPNLIKEGLLKIYGRKTLWTHAGFIYLKALSELYTANELAELCGELMDRIDPAFFSRIRYEGRNQRF